MDLQIPHDNNKLEDYVWQLWFLFLRILFFNYNSSNNEVHSIDLEECPPNHFTPSFRSTCLNKLKLICNAGNSSPHSAYNEDYLAVPGNFQFYFGECPPITCANKDNQRSITEDMLPYLDNYKLHWSNRNASRDPEFQHDDTYEYNRHIRKEIMRCLSSFALSTVVFLGISYKLLSSLSSVIHVPAPHKERIDSLSIWLSLLGFFGFMVFVCAVAVMILVRAPFTGVQKAMLIFWAILLHLQSANSIIDVFVTFVGALLMVWYAFGKKQPSNEVI